MIMMLTMEGEGSPSPKNAEIVGKILHLDHVGMAIDQRHDTLGRRSRSTAGPAAGLCVRRRDDQFRTRLVDRHGEGLIMPMNMASPAPA